MTRRILRAAIAVLGDLAKLRDKPLATIVAAGVVAIAAALLGAHLTTAEVTGWLVILGAGATVAERAARAVEATAPPPAPPPPAVKP